MEIPSRITRRRFAALAATLAAAPRLRAAAPGQGRIRAGVIGCRNRGNQVAANMIRTGRFDIAAICDCDSAMSDLALEKLKELLPQKPRVEKDFRRLLDDKGIDAVVVAAPDHWHALMTVMALDAGKHVYVEKPASHSIDDGKAMVAAAKRHPRQTVLVGSQQRSGRHFLDVKSFVDSGALGKVAFARGWILLDRGELPGVPDVDPPGTMDFDLWLGPAPQKPYNEKRTHYNWHFMRDYGTGDMGNWGAHWLDVIRWLLRLDLPHAVTAPGGRFLHRDAREFPDTQTALFEFPDLTVLWELRQWTRSAMNGAGNGIELAGEKGTLTLSRAGWNFSPKGEKAEKHPGTEIELVHAHNFADAIAGDAKPSADIIEGHKTATLIHLANIASQVNRRIEYDAANEAIVKDPEARALQGRPYRSPWKLS